MVLTRKPGAFSGLGGRPHESEPEESFQEETARIGPHFGIPGGNFGLLSAKRVLKPPRGNDRIMERICRVSWRFDARGKQDAGKWDPIMETQTAPAAPM